MPSLRQLNAAHGPLLLLDAASASIQVGWLDADGSQTWRSSVDEAGVAMFRLLKELGRQPGEAGAFVFCDGPGSILGIRTSAMAVRTWNILRRRPVFAYCSLALVAHGIGRREVSVIADARRDTWHVYSLAAGLRRVDNDALAGELVMPEGFRHWSALPTGVARCAYAVADWLPRVADADLFSAAENPDAFMHEEPSYVKWTPQIHRAPAAR